ncbi:hypothetical protein MYX84_00155 [Acidobacteria bacterium AH-259-O06]|nr:hypothetical protein [Acidobacteria bacterium AH-259-O06]
MLSKYSNPRLMSFTFWRKHPRLNRRRYQFIDRKQQIRFAVELGLHALLFPMLFLILTLASPLATVLVGEDAEHAQPLLQLFVGFCLEHWWVVLLALGFVSYVSVLFSHRIFGPMRRFENALLQKKNNPLEPVRCSLRQGDYFHKFSKLFEEVLNGSQAVEAPGQIVKKKHTGAEEVHPGASDAT